MCGKLPLSRTLVRERSSDLKISPGKSSRRDGRHRSLTHLAIRSAEPCVRWYRRNANLVLLLRVRAELDDDGDGDGAKTPRRISSSVRSRGARVRVAVSQSRD